MYVKWICDVEARRLGMNHKFLIAIDHKAGCELKIINYFRHPKFWFLDNLQCKKGCACVKWYAYA